MCKNNEIIACVGDVINEILADFVNLSSELGDNIGFIRIRDDKTVGGGNLFQNMEFLMLCVYSCDCRSAFYSFCMKDNLDVHSTSLVQLYWFLVQLHVIVVNHVTLTVIT